MTNKTLEQIIAKKITDQLKPYKLKVVNQSNLHQGHMGDDGSGESHFSIHISASCFDKISRLEGHRLIYDTLGKDIIKNVHALQIIINKNS